MYTTQRQIQRAFWREHRTLARVWVNGPSGPHRPQNLQPADTRMAFVNFVDALARSGDIAPELADKVTLD